MKNLFILICILTVESFTVKAQISTMPNKFEGKYFKYTVKETFRGAEPLFVQKPEMKLTEIRFGGRDWTDFSTEFVDQVLKKYLTVEEIRRMLKKGHKYAIAHLFIYFDYSGNIKYANFVYSNDLKYILTDEKLYYIYQGLMKLEIDTTGFEWEIDEKYPDIDQQMNLFGFTSIPFFFEKNCP